MDGLLEPVPVTLTSRPWGLDSPWPSSPSCWPVTALLHALVATLLFALKLLGLLAGVALVGLVLVGIAFTLGLASPEQPDVRKRD